MPVTRNCLPGEIAVSCHAWSKLSRAKCDAIRFGLRPIDHFVCFCQPRRCIALNGPRATYARVNVLLCPRATLFQVGPTNRPGTGWITQQDQRTDQAPPVYADSSWAHSNRLPNWEKESIPTKGEAGHYPRMGISGRKTRTCASVSPPDWLSSSSSPSIFTALNRPVCYCPVY
jgi:hypothetical protein